MRYKIQLHRRNVFN